MSKTVQERAAFGVLKTHAEALTELNGIKCRGGNIVALYEGRLGMLGSVEPIECIGYIIVPTGHDCFACGKRVEERET